MSDAVASHHAYIDAYAQDLDGGTWVSVDWTKHQGHAAVEAIGTDDKFDVRVLSIIEGQHAFGLSYYGPLGTAKSDEVNRVFASFSKKLFFTKCFPTSLIVKETRASKSAINSQI